MGWGEWCVPTLSDAQQFEVEKYKRAMHSLAGTDPIRLAGFAADLAHQNIALQSIVCKATAHIAALEVERDLRDDPRRRLRMHPASRAWRWAVDQIARRLHWKQSAS